ncbi:MAG: sigma 54-interacting transcriptional regulator [Bacteroidales bacterium]|nr:sigma 54-interacting transcriptional regulator [Bacteroidales bacterium]
MDKSNRNIQDIKQRFNITGNDPELERAIEVACQVAGTDLSVLVTGESGVGKESIPQIIHAFSPRKHGPYFAVNCGAIPEGTIDSELFGHEKGAFTGAIDTRKGYFEVANGGTLFLDEVAELPLSTQVRLLRVIQSGEFIKVGSSTVQKTDVRVIAATNVNLPKAIASGKFREDLYYRLNTVPITIPPLRARKDDIHLLFKKFAADFADRYVMPPVRLEPEAVQLLEAYAWPGNIRQLKSIAEQISVLEHERLISAAVLRKYLPEAPGSALPVSASQAYSDVDYKSDRELIFQILFTLRNEVDSLKERISGTEPVAAQEPQSRSLIIRPEDVRDEIREEVREEIREAEAQETISIQDANTDLIRRALERHGGNRKEAAAELGISERTLYRKIKQFDNK